MVTTELSTSNHPNELDKFLEVDTTETHIKNPAKNFFPIEERDESQEESRFFKQESVLAIINKIRNENSSNNSPLPFQIPSRLSQHKGFGTMPLENLDEEEKSLEHIGSVRGLTRNDSLLD